MYSVYIENQGTEDEYSIRAAEHIDILTFNRITDFESLTELQKRLIKRAYDRLTVFERDNEELINTYLANYSINGVSMSFGQSWNLKMVGGVAVPTDIYSMLLSTGLCYPAI